jgi:hypothetical protein
MTELELQLISTALHKRLDWSEKALSNDKLHEHTKQLAIQMIPAIQKFLIEMNLPPPLEPFVYPPREPKVAKVKPEPVVAQASKRTWGRKASAMPAVFDNVQPKQNIDEILDGDTVPW